VTEQKPAESTGQEQAEASEQKPSESEEQKPADTTEQKPAETSEQVEKDPETEATAAEGSYILYIATYLKRRHSIEKINGYAFSLKI
jgi:cell division septation protein DedD